MIRTSRYRVPFVLALVGMLGVGCGAPPDALNATSSSAPPNSGTPSGSGTVASGGAGTEPLVRTTKALDASSKYAFVNTLKEVGSWASDLAGFFSAVTTAIGLAQALGILHDPAQDIVVALQALHQEIDHTAGEITWYMEEIDRENRLADLKAQVLTNSDRMNNNEYIDWSFVDTDSAEKVGEGAVPAAFQRKFDEALTDGTFVTSPQAAYNWKSLIAYSQQDLQYDNGFVYDWRLGLPALMQLITLRIQLMAMEDPNFTTDFRFYSELMSYRDDLMTHILNLNAGLRCGASSSPPVVNPDGTSPYPNWEFWISCADIYSGFDDTQVFVVGDGYPLSISSCIVPGSDPQVYDQDCLNQEAVDYASWYQTNIQPAVTQAYFNVRNQTPWFYAQALMDTLYVYANGLTDPTRSDPAIRLSANTGLCLDVFGASTDAETPVEIYTCNGNAGSQSWAYDRGNQSIVETYSGLCLDVINGNWTPGTLLWTYWCNGTEAQKWSYDAVNHIFNNALGNVLDVPNDNLQSLQRVQTGPWTGGESQRWQ